MSGYGLELMIAFAVCCLCGVIGTLPELGKGIRRRWVKRDPYDQNKMLVACSMATFQNTSETVRNRLRKDHPYWSQAYADVCASVDREIALRALLFDERRQLSAMRRDSCTQDVEYRRMEAELIAIRKAGGA